MALRPRRPGSVTTQALVETVVVAVAFSFWWQGGQAQRGVAPLGLEAIASSPSCVSSGVPGETPAFVTRGRIGASRR